MRGERTTAREEKAVFGWHDSKAGGSQEGVYSDFLYQWFACSTNPLKRAWEGGNQADCRAGQARHQRSILCYISVFDGSFLDESAVCIVKLLLEGAA